MAGMKPFRRERRQYQLNFEEDPDLKGFEVLMSGVSLEQFIELTELSSSEEEGRTKAVIEAQFTMLATHLIEWNYCDEDGTAYTADYEGLKKLDYADVMKILKGWMQALTSVPKASSDDYSSGEISEELSLGLGSSSSALAS